MTVLVLIGAVFCTTALLCGVAAYAAPSSAVVAEAPCEILQVFASEDEAVRQLFPDAVTFRRAAVGWTAEQVEVIEQSADHQWTGAVEPVVYVAAAADGRALGYGVVMNEIGKHHEITFMVGVTPAEAVQGVDILIYRESRGGEVRQRRFLRQFRGKSLGDAVRGGVDIVNITGATLSVNAISRGVRKALAFVGVVFGEGVDRP